jgi:hypothetical protein
MRWVQPGKVGEIDADAVVDLFRRIFQLFEVVVVLCELLVVQRDDFALSRIGHTSSQIHQYFR